MSARSRRSFAQGGQLLARRHFTQREFHVGVFLRETAQRGRQNTRQHRRDVSHGQSFLRAFAECLHLLHRVAAAAEQIARVGEESFSGGSELEAGLFAVEQFDAEFLFEIAQLPAHRGLGNAQTRRRTADVQLFRDRHEVAQVPKFHSLADITERHGRPKNKALGGK